jgi:hypothetical protein
MAEKNGRNMEAFEKQMGKGRPKGVPNKNTTALKEMILGALDKAGGIDYLVAQAHDNPGPFLSLIGKVLPMTVASDPGGFIITVNTGVDRD